MTDKQVVIGVDILKPFRPENEKTAREQLRQFWLKKGAWPFKERITDRASSHSIEWIRTDG